MNDYTSARLDTSALITIDVQNDFTLDGAVARIPGTADVVPNIVNLLRLYRQRSLPIIHVVRLYLPDGSNAELCRKALIEGGTQIAAPDTDGAELVSALKPNPDVRLEADHLLAGKFQPIGDNEFLMYKPRWGAFYGTGLETFLRERGIDTLLFCGCNFPNCPRTSIYEASERDFRIAVATDALSQLYEKGENELANIGVSLLDSAAITSLFRPDAAQVG